MASRTRKDDPEEGVDFIHEDDGRIIACDTETGVASYEETKAQALRMLAEAVELHEEVASRSTTPTAASSGSTTTRRGRRYVKSYLEMSEAEPSIRR